MGIGTQTSDKVLFIELHSVYLKLLDTFQEKYPISGHRLVHHRQAAAQLCLPDKVGLLCVFEKTDVYSLSGK